MNKSIHFTGQPTFSQLLKFIPKEIVSNRSTAFKSDHYCKKFNTWHHLVTMLFSCYGGCSSLREVVSGMRAFEGRLLSTDIAHLPSRSTFSDANRRRDSRVFENIYYDIKRHWDKYLPDSRRKRSPSIYLMDSTVITLFQEIFKGSGSSYADGRRKGGLKVHMAVPLNDASPQYAYISDGATQDTIFSKSLNLPSGSTIIMDRGYRDFKQYSRWSSQGIRWVTRPWKKSYYEVISKRSIQPKFHQKGVLKDLEVILGYPQKKTSPVKARLIFYKDLKTRKELEFITNDMSSNPLWITQLYRKRWDIEKLFKRLKQNMPLNYFLGDNKNAIQIQIWCALIADLLLNIVRRHIAKKWAFSNLVSIVRLHLFNYLNLFSFLENPEKCSISTLPLNIQQLKLNFSG
jgi:hypothetical protein